MSGDVNYFICDDFFGDDGLLYSLLYKCYVNQKEMAEQSAISFLFIGICAGRG